MRLEGRKFLEHVLTEGDGKLATFLTAPYTFVNGPLAAYYGVNGVTGDPFQQGRPGPDQALGLPDPVRVPVGARHARQRADQPGVPRDLRAREPAVPADSRSAAERRGREPALHAHHHPARVGVGPHGEAGLRQPATSKIDPMGFGFENFDAIGRADQTGQAGRRRRQAGRQRRRRRPSTAWWSWARSWPAARWSATAWPPSGSASPPAAPRPTATSAAWARMKEAFSKAGGDLRELFVAFTQTDAFLFRSKGDAP